MQTVIVSSKGQISIPAKIRKALHLEKSMRLQIEVEQNSVVLTPIRDEESWCDLRGSLKGKSLSHWIEREHTEERKKNK